MDNSGITATLVLADELRQQMAAVVAEHGPKSSTVAHPNADFVIPSELRGDR